MDGLLYVDKPAGITSHDVVAVVRRAARTKRVGHAGTLDPFATGLLVLAVGACTRLLPYVAGEPKVYEALVRFGAETDSDDATGQVTVERALPPAQQLEQRARDAIASLTGVIAQVPPAFSAKHVDGQRAYALARRGADVVLPPVTVTVHRWELLALSPERARVRITCAGGTYVRALARDLGRALDSAGHCEALRRIASGPASVDAAVPLERLTPGAIADGDVPLRPVLPALGDIVREHLDDAALRDVHHGRAIAATHPGLVPGTLGALVRDERVVGIATATASGRWQPKVVLA